MLEALQKNAEQVREGLVKDECGTGHHAVWCFRSMYSIVWSQDLVMAGTELST
jgi:hypothetical protein